MWRGEGAEASLCPPPSLLPLPPRPPWVPDSLWAASHPTLLPRRHLRLSRLFFPKPEAVRPAQPPSLDDAHCTCKSLPCLPLSPSPPPQVFLCPPVSCHAIPGHFLRAQPHPVGYGKVAKLPSLQL